MNCVGVNSGSVEFCRIPAITVVLYNFLSKLLLKRSGFAPAQHPTTGIPSVTYSTTLQLPRRFCRQSREHSSSPHARMDILPSDSRILAKVDIRRTVTLYDAGQRKLGSASGVAANAKSHTFE